MGEFYYHVPTTSFGPYVDQIGRYPGGGSSGWVFKVDGASPPVGADQVALHDGDTVLWYYATFGPNGGPQTLALREGRGGTATGSSPRTTPARPARRGARSMSTAGASGARGAGCVGPHVGLVRATLAGAVRSNAL